MLKKNKKPSLYPKVLHVGAVRYKIKFVTGLRICGDCDASKRVIRIRSGMSDFETAKTFIHELLHALSFEYDIRLKHKTIYELEQPILELLLQNFRG